ncbi:TPA: DUF551 domain-containing protein [Yersinia enterocolitica]|nr:DUF551 domain-containing protein [Yersinia enterocolitica]HDL7879608.1 DUF551 domain-containing protein [Yersinia enterocolitica]HDL7891722.1 DUF551 domain-containing protein [Yersinia enterocolitica]HDM8317615.1 DUF551 domain-containing protein [Yersinia enterocolitica]HEF7241531.1 DUF551 domain-containing protein [Yersinia enterocolitica]
MKSLDSFTVERLEELIGFTHGNGIDHANRTEWQALARIALAAKRAEPVYQYHTGIINEEGDIDWYWVDCDKGFYSQYDNQHRRIVYTTPQLNSQVPLGSWIKCSDQMPEVGDVVITAYQGCTNVGQMERSGKTYRYFTSIASGRELPATHWMPLPAAPEKENG